MLAQLRQHGISPAPVSSNAVSVRRVYYECPARVWDASEFLFMGFSIRYAQAADEYAATGFEILINGLRHLNSDTTAATDS